jgi:hypothetical protein
MEDISHNNNNNNNNNRGEYMVKDMVIHMEDLILIVMFHQEWTHIHIMGLYPRGLVVIICQEPQISVHSVGR